jgi:hypothetical protein
MLSLLHYFFSEIMFQAFPPEDGSEKVLPESVMSYSHTPVEDSGKFQILLRVASEEEEKGLYLYRFRIASVGVFRWKDELPEEPGEGDALVEKLIITGLSILYSGTRNMLQTITSTGPYPLPYLLQISKRRTNPPSQGGQVRMCAMPR